MTIRTTMLPLLLALLVTTIPLAGAQGKGEVRFQSIEVAGTGHTTGSLAGLLIDHRAPDLPIASPDFTLDSPDARIVSNHALAYSGGTSAGARPETVHASGPATIEGVESRARLHFWITPIGPGATIEVQHRDCTDIREPQTNQTTRDPTLEAGGRDVITDTQNTAAIGSCLDALAVIRGDLAITAWEWDMLVNGQRVDSGVSDATSDTGLPSSGTGSADELAITVHDATLTIPLTPSTYELFVANPHLEATDLRIKNVEGTMPGLLEVLEGEDVDLVGTYTATIDATTTPFTATFTGTTTDARTPHGPLSLQVPETPGPAQAFLPWLFVFAGLVASVLAVYLYRIPARAYHTLWSRHELTLTLAPRDPRQRRALGWQLLGVRASLDGQTKRAQRIQHRAAKLYEDSMELMLGLGEALLALGAYKYALDSLFIVSESPEASPTQRTRAQVGTAFAYHRRSEPNDALLCAEFLRFAEATDPTTVQRILEQAGATGRELRETTNRFGPDHTMYG